MVNRPPSGPSWAKKQKIYKLKNEVVKICLICSKGSVSQFIQAKVLTKISIVLPYRLFIQYKNRVIDEE